MTLTPSVGTRIKLATLSMLLFAGFACSPLLFTIFRLINMSPEPPGDDENLAIRLWFLSWGIVLTLLIGVCISERIGLAKGAPGPVSGWLGLLPHTPRNLLWLTVRAFVATR